MKNLKKSRFKWLVDNERMFSLFIGKCKVIVYWILSVTNLILSKKV